MITANTASELQHLTWCTPNLPTIRSRVLLLLHPGYDSYGYDKYGYDHYGYNKAGVYKYETTQAVTSAQQP
jgi:hypothetical protein